MPKIALCGKMRSGKDTVAEYLESNYGYERFAFGDELKRYYHELFGYSEAKDREGYQWLGQTMRERDKDIWVRKCFDAMFRYYCEEAHGRAALFKPVITDVRQPNELERCRAEGFVIVKVEADETTRLERIQAKGDDFNLADLRHATEMFVDEIDADYTIWNGTGVSGAELKRHIDDIMSKLNVYHSSPSSSTTT